MKSRFTARVLVASIMAVLSLTTSAFAASADYYLKIEGVDGEATAIGHENWIDLTGFHHEMLLPAVQKIREAAPKSSGKVQFQDLHITMAANKATEKLAEACANGRRLPGGTIDVVKTDDSGVPHTYLKVTMSDILISSFSSTGAPGSEVSNSVTLTFGSSTYKYSQRDSNGNVEIR